MPKIVDTEAQRRNIRQAARHVFAQRGVTGTGLTHVADHLGMSRSSLYHYYPDKASLVAALSTELLEEEVRLFHAATHGEGTALARIERLAAGVSDLFAEWSDLGRMFLQLWSTDAARFRPLFRRLRKNLAQVIAAGQRAGEIDTHLEPTMAAAIVIGAIDGLLLQHLVDPRAFRDLDALSASLVAAVRKGLAP